MEQVRQLLSLSDDGVVAIDPRQVIAFCNDAAESILGYAAEELRGRYCYDVLRGCDPDGCATCRRECLATRAARRGQCVATRRLRAERKGGRFVWLDVSTLVMPMSARSFILLAHLFRDAGHAVETESTLRQLLWMSHASTTPSELGKHGLTRREQEVLFQLVNGCSTREISRKLFISATTVRNHVKHVLAKLNAHSRIEAVSIAVRDKLL